MKERLEKEPPPLFPKLPFLKGLGDVLMQNPSGPRGMNQPPGPGGFFPSLHHTPGHQTVKPSHYDETSEEMLAKENPQKQLPKVSKPAAQPCYKPGGGSGGHYANTSGRTGPSAKFVSKPMSLPIVG